MISIRWPWRRKKARTEKSVTIVSAAPHWSVLIRSKEASTDASSEPDESLALQVVGSTTRPSLAKTLLTIGYG
jgi:hypothetical protein